MLKQMLFEISLKPGDSTISMKEFLRTLSCKEYVTAERGTFGEFTTYYQFLFE